MMSGFPFMETRYPHEEAKDMPPKIDFNLREHKTSIIVNWAILFITACVLPIVLYFALRYAARLQLGTVLTVTTAILSVVSLFSLVQRLWLLLRQQSTCRPLGASRKALDYFMWNFLAGFAGVTAVIVAGSLLQNIRTVTLGLPILVVDVSAQLLVVGLLYLGDVRAPFRISSVGQGARIRPGTYTLAEDIVAVDGGQGQLYRQQLQDRYLKSPHIRSLFFRLDMLWGISGLCIGVVCIALILALPNADVAYTLGWAVPWGYAAVMTLITFRMVSTALRREGAFT